MDVALYALLMGKLKNKEATTLNGISVEVVDIMPPQPMENTLYILLEGTNSIPVCADADGSLIVVNETDYLAMD